MSEPLRQHTPLSRWCAPVAPIRADSMTFSDRGSEHDAATEGPRRPAYLFPIGPLEPTHKNAGVTAPGLAEPADRRQNVLMQNFNNVPALVSYIDTGLVYRFANARCLELLGHRMENVIGQQACTVLGETLFREIEPWCRQALSGLPAMYEVSRTIRGAVRHFSVCHFPDCDREGRVQGFYSLTHDITDSRRIAAALEESERRIRTITDNIPALISQFDAQERCRFANRRFLEYFDVPAPFVPGVALRDLVGAENYRLIKDEMDTAMAGLPVTFERALRVRGEPRFVSIALMPQFDASGAVTGCYGLTQDVTARKLAEMARMRSEERLRTITDNMPALIAYLDARGRFQFANRTWEEWLGQRTRHLIGYTAATVLQGSGADPLLPKLNLALHGENVEFEAELELPGGTRHVRGTFLPQFDEDSQLLGIYGLIHDITAQKLVEMQLSRLACFDSLTGLPNRNLLLERMSMAVARVRAGPAQPDSNRWLGLLFLDLDGFKQINDTHGHAAGDAVLQQFAHRLAACVRETDTVARLAGDEFIILLEDLDDPESARAVADKVIAKMERPCVIDGASIALSTSIGITIYRGEPATNDALLKRADQALYEAKQAGRNQYCLSA